MKTLKGAISLLLLFMLTSCGEGKLVTQSVSYQSVRTVQYKEQIPAYAKIAVGYSITSNGELIAVVKNLTDEIMIIDQTKSFVVTPDGTSISYYDPTVRVTSNTNSTSSTEGASVNLGAVAGFLGIGGPIGGLLSGVNVGEANTLGYSTTNTTYFKDMPQISLAPKSHGAMSKNFEISGIGNRYTQETYSSFTNANSYCKFSVCISYSLDGGKTFDKLVTPFYANSLMVCPVRRHGRVNDALRTILQNKPDAINEQWWVLKAINSGNESKKEMYESGFSRGALLDWQ